MNENTDLTVATNILMADGIGRQGIGLINLLHKDIKINVLQFPPCKYSEVPKEILPLLSQKFESFGKVLFWTYILGINDSIMQYHKLADSKIKIAYSMFESSLIPPMWVKILNDYYDMVVVPDEWLVSVYKNSGVKKPIFVLPLGIIIEHFLEQPVKQKANDVFSFGMTGGFYRRKNHIKVLKAFKKNFANDPKYQLRVHGRFGPQADEIKKAFSDENVNNAVLYTGSFNQDTYLSFMNDLDCYVFVSQGEGFSITPRESLSLEIPTILSNNTVHKTICNSGFTFNVKADIKQQAKYEVFQNKTIGNYFDCDVNDLANEMLKVASNYEEALQKTRGAREWVKQYTWPSLKHKYLSLFKPSKISLGENNVILDDQIITNSKDLYNKYKEL